MSKRFLVETRSENEDYSADCEYAAITLSDEMLEKLKECRQVYLRLASEMVKVTGDSSISYGLYMSWFDYSADYFSYDQVEELLEYLSPDSGQALSERDVVALEQSLAKEPQRTECGRISVTDFGVSWSTIPKHCDFRVNTPEISWETLLGDGQ